MVHPLLLTVVLNHQLQISPPQQYHSTQVSQQIMAPQRQVGKKVEKKKVEKKKAKSHVYKFLLSKTNPMEHGKDLMKMEIS